MQYRVPVADQVVRHQHSMTTKEDTLRAHDGGVRALCSFNQPLNRGLKLGREHIVGVIPERSVSQCHVRRLISWHLPFAMAAQVLFPNIVAADLRKPQLQALAIEVRMAARGGKSSDVLPDLNMVRLPP